MFRIIPHRALVEPSASVIAVDSAGRNARATLRVDGLLCSACAANVRGRLECLPGVSNVTVDLDGGEARVEYDASLATPAVLTAAVEGAVVLRPARRILAKLAHRTGIASGERRSA